MSRVRIVGLVLVIAALLAIPLIVSAQTTQGPVTVTLNPQNNSGESGSATLTDLGNNQTKVEVNVTGQPAGVPQPEHIHQGTCANLNPQPAYPLNNLVDGTSVTTVSVSLSTLMSGQFAVNGHKSAQDLQTYVYCGEINTSASGTATTTAGGAASAVATSTTTAAATSTPATTATTTTLATSTPAVAATTVTTTTGQPSTLPTTGGSASNFAPLMLVLGLLVLGAGIIVRRFAA